MAETLYLLTDEVTVHRSRGNDEDYEAVTLLPGHIVKTSELTSYQAEWAAKHPSFKKVSAKQAAAIDKQRKAFEAQQGEGAPGVPLVVDEDDE